MNKKIILGCIFAIIIVVFSTFPSVVGKSSDNNSALSQEINKIIQHIIGTNDGWHLGFFIELIIGTIFIILILIGILTQPE